ncbi:GNAT family N-acetyltransferase [Kocuria tytonicola]|uniref:GNAT family N-acetyltransferase n=1 Tax=Kocuria tytonicola TaxID=2055946 RepID=UPI000EF94749|nr:GNAT family N-acetyltransferase [Kocuria tytonicola]RLZ02540.1 GNAT family N-acetyltransferase [Kocuria tytonicola]
MSDVTLTTCRRASEQDVEALVALRAEMFCAMGTQNIDGPWVSAARSWFAERIHDPAFGIFVVASGGSVVACSVAAIRDAAPSPGNPHGRDVLISNVCTFPEYRGSGYGRRAFSAALEWAHRTGVPRAELMATAAGRGMYARAGFAETTFPAMRADI